MNTISALIVDDEPLARQHLHRLLGEQSVQIVGEAENAAQAIQMTEDLRPDLLFLDIQMPGLTGLQLAEALRQSSEETLLIFVTGYSEYAMEAFEHAALDYLVKPVSSPRLVKTLLRARERMADVQARIRTEEQTEPEIHSDTPRLQRLPIRQDYAVRLARVEEIIYATARDKRVFVRVGESEFRTYYTLTQLENLLPTDLFLRIHDSAIVNVNFIEELTYLGNHTYGIVLSNGEQLPVSRSRYPQLQKRFGLEMVVTG
jgi:DNA-binding LytR/AlgR family response regulator